MTVTKTAEPTDSKEDREAQNYRAVDPLRGAYVQGRRGRLEYPWDPQPEDVRWSDVAHSLALTNRFNGRTPEPYSVAQHCVLVGQQAMRDAIESGMDDERELWAVAVWGVIHDASEASVGDLISPIKYGDKSLREMWARLEGAHQWAAATAAELPWPLPERVSAAVSRADKRMVLTEARDMLGGQVVPWFPGTDLAPYDDHPPIIPWGWRRAEELWLQALNKALRRYWLACDNAESNKEESPCLHG